MTKSFFASILIIICAALIESTILVNLYILPVIPDLVLITCVYLSLLNGRTFGQVTGFFSGLVLDFITGVPFGLNCIFRTILGYVYGLFANHIIITGIVVPVLTVGSATILKALLIKFIALFFTAINPSNIISIDFLIELIFNIVLSPFIFKFLEYFRKTLAINPEHKSVNV